MVFFASLPHFLIIKGAKTEDAVAIDNSSLRIAENHPVAVTVEGNSDIGLVLQHKFRNILWMSRTAVPVDVEPVRLI